jgi:hypothetical protein
MKKAPLIITITTLTLLCSCTSNVVSTKLGDYEMKEIDRNTGKWYPFREKKTDSLFLASEFVQFSKMYYYVSKEEQLDTPDQSIYNHVRGYIEYAHFFTDDAAVAFFQELIGIKYQIDCAIRIGSDVYALDDDKDIKVVALEFKEKIEGDFARLEFEEYMNPVLQTPRKVR